MGIFFSTMKNDIQNRFALLYYKCNKVQFRIFLCYCIEKWRYYASFFLNGSVSSGITVEILNLEQQNEILYFLYKNI